MHNLYNFFRVTIIFFFLVIISSSGLANAFEGKVTSLEDIPFADATVQAFQNGKKVKGVLTDAEGRYSISDVQTDQKYDLRVYAAGYIPRILPQVTPTAIDFYLLSIPTVEPTPYSAAFLSKGQSHWISGEAKLQVGDVILAIDKNNDEDPENDVIAGAAVVEEEGTYTIHVYGDDPTTDEDEGPDDGDVIYLGLNSFLLNNTFYTYCHEETWISITATELNINFDTRLPLQDNCPIPGALPLPSSVFEGKVTASDGDALANATVQAFRDGEKIAEVLTDAEGRYSIPDVQIDQKYNLRVYVEGYIPQILPQVTPAAIDFYLLLLPTVERIPYSAAFWGQGNWMSGETKVPLQAGDVVLAIDKNNDEDPENDVIAGVGVVREEGSYDIHVYGDDPTTDEDEGPEEGDVIYLGLNSFQSDSTSYTYCQKMQEGQSVAVEETWAMFTATELDIDFNTSPPLPGDNCPIPHCLVDWDLNGDCVVDISDLIIVAKHFGEEPPTDPRADVNGDGKVDLSDLVEVVTHFD